jgi:hypothetical protein
MIDRLPSQPRVNECAIVNLQPYSMDGSHWVCYIKKGSCVQYYDSFGDMKSPPEVHRYMKGCSIFYNTEREQAFGTVICGHLCLRFLLYAS